jgi:hypothetical protein
MADMSDKSAAADRFLAKIDREAESAITHILAVAREACGDLLDGHELKDRDKPWSLTGLRAYMMTFATVLELAKPRAEGSYLSEARQLQAWWNHYLSLTAEDELEPEPEPIAFGRPSVIYFLSAGDKLKIGFTSDLNQRMTSLSATSPVPLTLLHSTPGTMADERSWHRRFADYRLHGEWFRLQGELAAYLAEVAVDSGDGS